LMFYKKNFLFKRIKVDKVIFMFNVGDSLFYCKLIYSLFPQVYKSKIKV
jgi:hypothetical protein